jgi:hypothetical protein
VGLHGLVQGHPLAVGEQLVTSQSDRALSRLSVAASFGLVLMVGATAGYIGWPRVAAAIGIRPAVPPPAYSTGQQIDVPRDWYGSASHTLVLFARASCGACDKAQPFLKSLVSSLNGRAAAVMAHPAATVAEDAAFARGLGIADSDIRVVTADLRVRATPTLVLVNQQGAILAAWEGVGSTERQAEVLRTINAKLQ